MQYSGSSLIQVASISWLRFECSAVSQDFPNNSKLYTVVLLEIFMQFNIFCSKVDWSGNTTVYNRDFHIFTNLSNVLQLCRAFVDFCTNMFCKVQGEIPVLARKLFQNMLLNCSGNVSFPSSLEVWHQVSVFNISHFSFSKTLTIQNQIRLPI